MNKLNFRKIVKRNDFTTIFGGVGQRRKLKVDRLLSFKLSIRRIRGFFWGYDAKYSFRRVKKTKLQGIRRGHQGWRNKTFASIHALKIRRMFGRRKPIAQLRR